MKRLTAVVLAAVLCLGLCSFTATATDKTAVSPAKEIKAVVDTNAGISTKAVVSGPCGDNLTWSFNTDTGLLRISGTGAMSFPDDVRPWSGYSSQITSVEIADGVTTIEKNAFNSCAFSSIDIPDSVVSIGAAAFYCCSALESIDIPLGVTKIEQDTFYGCGLKSIVIPDSILSIGNNAFMSCSLLESVTLGEGVATIGSMAFSSCTSLKSFTFGDGMDVIEDCLGDCTSLEKVVIGKSSDIQARFRTCTALVSIEVSKDNPNYSSEDGILFNKDKTELLCYPIGKTDSVYSIPVSVASVGSRAFEKCVNLKSVDISTNVISIKSSAFSGCTALESISIPNTVTSIGTYAFDGCTALASVDLPDGLLKIDEYVFRGCSSLKNITLPDGIETLGYRAFENSGLTSIVLPDSVVGVGAWALSTMSLVSVTLSDNLGYIGEYAFCCGSFTEIVLPDTVHTIQTGAFDRCYELKEVYYTGSEERWNSINISPYKNDRLLEANIVYLPHFEFIDEKDKENITVSDSKKGVYFKAGGVAAQELPAMFTNGDVVITKADGTPIANTNLVGTGCTITSTIKGITKTYTIVVLGDITGDGKIGATDYAQVLNHAKGKLGLSGAKLEAANVAAASSNVINAADYGLILNVAKGAASKFNTVIE